MQTRSKILIASVGGAILLGLTGGALASKMHEGGKYEGRGGHMSAILGMVDADKDGKVTRAEADAFRDAQFAKFDADGNGSLDDNEYLALMEDFRRQMMLTRFKRYDTDGNGVISKDEMSGRIGKMFTRMDRNDDGVIEADEMGRKHHRGHHDDDNSCGRKDHGDDGHHGMKRHGDKDDKGAKKDD
jgi:hypothetical protein